MHENVNFGEVKVMPDTIKQKVPLPIAHAPNFQGFFKPMYTLGGKQMVQMFELSGKNNISSYFLGQTKTKQKPCNLWIVIVLGSEISEGFQESIKTSSYSLKAVGAVEAKT